MKCIFLAEKFGILRRISYLCTSFHKHKSIVEFLVFSHGTHSLRNEWVSVLSYRFFFVSLQP